MNPFADRRDAGRQLASALHRYKALPQALVLALPRGGVPIAAEIARFLSLPLDVFVVRKLGAPGQPELAMGAIASGNTVVMNPEVSNYFANQHEAVETIVQSERRELQRREHLYRDTRPVVQIADRVTILVDDGAATGASMRVAVQALRLLKAKQVVVALPVCSLDAAQFLRKEADDFVCLGTPQDFYAVGQWYKDFEQTTDLEVCRLLSGEDEL